MGIGIDCYPYLQEFEEQPTIVVPGSSDAYQTLTTSHFLIPQLGGFFCHTTPLAATNAIHLICSLLPQDPRCLRPSSPLLQKSIIDNT